MLPDPACDAETVASEQPQHTASTQNAVIQFTVGKNEEMPFAFIKGHIQMNGDIDD